jgi:hypothetical protein
MQVKKIITKHLVLGNIPRNMYGMPQYVKICGIKFNCGDSNAMIHGDGYF